MLASDISDNPDLEIKNPDFCIANITMKTELVINMIVSTEEVINSTKKKI